jgi:DNA-binding XRE family transcriptional regulator
MITDIVLLRRKHALTQSELADLLGISQKAVSRLEDAAGDQVHHLRLETAFAIQVVFGKRPSQLFSRLFNEVEDAVMGRAAEFDRALDGRSDRATEHKRALLSDMVRRAANQPLL